MRSPSKTMDLKVRPIHHRLETRVRAHLFLCMLAYYVEWHLREAWRELMFADEDLDAKRTRDPVAPAPRSSAALNKIARRTLNDGTPVHSFQTRLQELSTIVRNTCQARGDTRPASPTFQMIATPSVTQRRAIELLNAVSPEMSSVLGEVQSSQQRTSTLARPPQFDRHFAHSQSLADFLHPPPA